MDPTWLLQSGANHLTGVMEAAVEPLVLCNIYSDLIFQWLWERRNSTVQHHELFSRSKHFVLFFVIFLIFILLITSLLGYALSVHLSRDKILDLHICLQIARVVSVYRQVNGQKTGVQLNSKIVAGQTESSRSSCQSCSCLQSCTFCTTESNLSWAQRLESITG